MTGIDGTAILPLHIRPQPLDGPPPDVFTAFDEEFFVEWQVADAGPSVPDKHIILR